MSDADRGKADPPTRDTKDEATFAKRVGRAEQRKLVAQRTPTHVWSGLGVMGVVGWTVAAPALLGAALGRWLDRRPPAGHAWTLALLVAGLAIGCGGAWYWTAQQTAAMRARRP